MQYEVIDIESEQYKQDEQRLQSLRTMIVLWLILLALGVVLIPLMLIAGWVRSDMTRLEGELLTLQNAIGDATNPSQETVQLNAELTYVKQLISAVQTATVPTSANWPLVVRGVAQYEDLEITLTTLTQTDTQIRLTGRAMSNDAVVRYQQRLLDSRAFLDVAIVSMTTVAPLTEVEGSEENGDKDTSALDPTGLAATASPLESVEFVIDLLLEMPIP